VAASLDQQVDVVAEDRELDNASAEASVGAQQDTLEQLAGEAAAQVHDMAGDAQGDVRGSSVTEDLARAMGDTGAGRATRPASAVALAAPGRQLQLLLLGSAARHDLSRLTLFLDGHKGISRCP
jgi:hypothetical protein